MNETMRYTEARTNSTGKGKSCGVTFLRGNENVKLVIQTPKMWCQFGIDEYKPDDGGPTKYSIRLGFKNLQAGPAQRTRRRRAHWARRHDFSLPSHPPLAHRQGFGQYTLDC